MITLQEIENDLRTCYRNMHVPTVPPRIARQYRKKAAHIETIKKLLKHVEPTDEYLQREAERIQKRIMLLESQRKTLQPVHLHGKEITKWRRDYNKLNNMPHLQQQLFSIQYMLKQVQIV